MASVRLSNELAAWFFMHAFLHAYLFPTPLILTFTFSRRHITDLMIWNELYVANSITLCNIMTTPKDAETSCVCLKHLYVCRTNSYASPATIARYSLDTRDFWATCVPAQSHCLFRTSFARLPYKFIWLLYEFLQQPFDLNKAPACRGQRSSVKSWCCKGTWFCLKALQSYAP